MASILLDQNMPHGLRHLLVGHDVSTAHRMSWSDFRGGNLIAAAEAAGFDAMLTLIKVCAASRTSWSGISRCWSCRAAREPAPPRAWSSHGTSSLALLTAAAGLMLTFVSRPKNSFVTDFSDRTRDLSPELQDEAARLLLLFVGDEGPTAKLTPEEAGLAEADAEIARGEFTT